MAIYKFESTLGYKEVSCCTGTKQPKLSSNRSPSLLLLLHIYHIHIEYIDRSYIHLHLQCGTSGYNVVQ